MTKESVQKKGHGTIDAIATRASFWAALASLIIVAIFAVITILQERHSIYNGEYKRLGTIAGPLARSVAAEMLVGDSRSLSVLLSDYREKYALHDIEILFEKPAEQKEFRDLVVPPRDVTWTERLPGISPPRYLQLTFEARGKEGPFSGLWRLIWICVPLFFFGVFVTLRIQRDLRKSIVQPIQNLARDPEKWQADGPWVAAEATTLHQHLLKYIKERDLERDNAEKLRIEASIGEVAAQVAHDIRSPLAALDMVAAHLEQIPEEKRIIIRTAISRIRDIANGLLEKHRAQIKETKATSEEMRRTAESVSNELGGQELLSSLIDSLVTEKRLQYRSKWGVQIEAPLSSQGYGLFANVNGSDFKRVLSNLINNSVEAVGERGTIKVELSSKNDRVFVRVRDDGPGIAPEVVPKLMQRGETHGKQEGHGLGLYSAKKKVEEWGGVVVVTSSPGKGTTVELDLPRAEIPRWFVSSLVIPASSNVIILDDDTTIHQIWEGRFESLQLRNQSIEFVHLSTAPEFVRFVAEHRGQQLFLVDYELIGSVKSGLDLIEELGIAPRSILVTSRFEEKDIRRRCAKLGVRMIPKSLAGFVPISVEALSKRRTDGGRDIQPRMPV